MSDGLEEFVDGAWDEESSDAKQGTDWHIDSFLFRFGENTYALRAADVVGVIPWRTPVPLPRSDPRVGGVIQDRGRIVVLMAHPTGEPRTAGEFDPVRVIICPTECGYVGLPATATLLVGPVRYRSEPQPLETVDTDSGPVTFLDPARYVVR
jgi:hypothetical protein